jgi:hypothetical protein
MKTLAPGLGGITLPPNLNPTSILPSHLASRQCNRNFHHNPATYKYTETHLHPSLCT